MGWGAQGHPQDNRSPRALRLPGRGTWARGTKTFASHHAALLHSFCHMVVCREAPAVPRASVMASPCLGGRLGGLELFPGQPRLGEVGGPGQGRSWYLWVPRTLQDPAWPPSLPPPHTGTRVHTRTHTHRHVLTHAHVCTPMQTHAPVLAPLGRVSWSESRSPWRRCTKPHHVSPEPSDKGFHTPWEGGLCPHCCTEAWPSPKPS